MAKYKFIDLFAGCGGLEDGFLQTGKYSDVAAVEWLKPQVNTLIRRLETKWGVKDAKERVMHFLLFDDMQRSDISSLLGDAVGAVGTESEQVMLHLNSGTTVEVTPNFYIVGTYNSAETGAIPLSNELYGRFYVREILSDIEYITDDKESENAVLYSYSQRVLQGWNCKF